MNKHFLLLLGILLFSCESEQQFIKNQSKGNALGTTYNIIYISDQKLNFNKEIDSVFQAVNQSMSTYIPDSDISKINNGDSTVVVDHMFREVFNLSNKIYKQTDGVFDPTVGTLVNAWGFGPGKQIALDSLRIDSLLNYVGFSKVKIEKNRTITKASPEIYFDFNAIAKGYAIDRVGKMLKQKGVKNYLVEVGGEVLSKGKNIQSGSDWTVGVDDPQAEGERTLKKILTLKDKAMASSGNYRKFRVDPETGEKYVHTIDAKTGYTKNGNVLAATVVANTCAEADAYATTFMAMDLEDSMAFLKKYPELEAYLIYLDETGRTQEFMTAGFKLFVKE